MAEKVDYFNGGRGSISSGELVLVNGGSTNSGSSTSTTSGSSTSTTSGSSTSQTSQISDSMAVELMLTEETTIKDADSRNTFKFDDLDFISSSIPPNQYSYATTYYTTFYVRNYSYSWNANSYLSVNINGNVTDIYADSYDTVRMDYYPPEAPADKDVIDVIKFHVNSDTTNQYKSFERGNYIVWNKNSVLPSANQPYCSNGLLYIDAGLQQNGLTYATVSKNLKFVLDSETSNDEINAIKQWWINSYFTYVANIWECTDADTQGSSLTNNYSISLDNIPGATNEYVLICGQFIVEGESIQQYTITVVSDNDTMGSVTGSGTFDYLSTQTIEAIPATHYHFTYWNDGIMDNPRTIQVQNDYTFTAYFEQNAQYTVTIDTDPSNGGNTNGDGTYETGQSVTLTATANEHYIFIKWTKGDVEVSTRERYTFNINEENAGNYTAHFRLRSYEIDVKVLPDNNYGVISGGGTYEYGTTVTLKAEPKNGYNFVRWSDDVTTSTRDVQVTGNATYSAEFA